MGVSDRAHAVVSLLLRALTLLLLVAALVIVATDKIYGPFTGVADPPNFTFRDVHALRYVLSAAVIGCAYTLLVIPFAAIHVAQGKRLWRAAATVFIVFTDVVVAVLIATGAAAGLGLSVEYQRLFVGDDDSEENNFCVLVNTSCGLMMGAVACMVAMVVISVHSVA